MKRETIFATAVVLILVLTMSLTMSLTSSGVAVATIESCDHSGNPKDIFDPGEEVYAKGIDYDPGESVTIYVVPNGGPYTASSSFTVASADAWGNIGPTPIGSYVVGKYDIWVDRDGDGTRHDGNIILKNEPVDTFGLDYGFFVVPEYPLGTILGVAMCFAALAVFKSKSLRIHL